MTPILLCLFGNLVQMEASIKLQAMYPYLWSINLDLRGRDNDSGK